MKILFVASEAEPFIKTGGLADVAQALPKYLENLDIEVRVVIPKYKNIKYDPKYTVSFKKSFTVPVGWRNQYCGVFEAEVEKVKYYFIDNEYYFLRDTLYGHYDDGERFAFFDRAVLMMLKELDWKPDIIHCNDWHTGMIPVLYKLQYEKEDFYKNIRVLYSIHNILFQGNYDPKILGELFGYSEDIYKNGSVELNGAVSFMKGGINYSDKISTVSTTYAKELQTPQFGEKLDGLLRRRAADLSGIVNGIDYDIFNPEKDDLIYKKYSKYNLKDKGFNKRKLQMELGLRVSENTPMIGIVSRLTPQKGMDLVKEIGEEFLKRDIQLVVLGTGDSEYEDYFRYLGKKYPDKVSANIFFDNSLSHKIYAASDIFLMPSLFEPCGLGQLIALRYGTLPIVRETGGLRDTIKPYNRFTGEGNGFSFTYYNAHDLFYVMEMTLQYYKNKYLWKTIVIKAMESDNSWNKSAKRYKELYESMF
ncbi:glycogen synthase GlgA [Clostridium thailandense]|uniref:glycogen synthase GlgA n=1 Tax=Clostridium thailandense TaxID=2794346 RepID=UPI00398A2212